MIAKTTRDPVLYSATSSGLVRVGNAADRGRGAGQRASSPRTRPTSTPSSSPRPRWPRRSSRTSASTCRPSAIAGRFSATVDADVNALTVTAIGSTPEEARDLANAVVDAVVVVAQEIETGEANPTQATLTRIVPLEEAQLPGAPFTPDYRKAAMKGAIGGLGLAYAVPHRAPPHRPPGPLGQARRGGHRRLGAGHHPQGGRPRSHPPRRPRRPGPGRRVLPPAAHQPALRRRRQRAPHDRGHLAPWPARASPRSRPTSPAWSPRPAPRCC